MSKRNMYTDRKANVAAFRGCDFGCVYCAFKNTMFRSKCADCRAFKPHAHLEVLEKRPPPTKDGEFLTMGLNGDIAFASKEELRTMLLYCNKWSDRTFVLQTKDPSIFREHTDLIHDNMIIGTTLETNIHDYHESCAPKPIARYWSLKDIECRKMVTIEPIMKFTSGFAGFITELNLESIRTQADIRTGFAGFITELNPEIVYIGYDSKNNHLPEPTLAETLDLIEQLRDAGLDVREKLIRKAWDEA